LSGIRNYPEVNKAAVKEMDNTINKILSKYNLTLQEFV
jgi:hypothetical protein